MTTVGYLRVSTERQAGEVVTSLGDQERAVTLLAARMGRTVQHWFRDEGASGATVEARPAFQELLAFATMHPQPRRTPGYILVLNDSRFGRFPDPEESAYWRVHLSKLGWLVRFVEGDESENKTMRSVMRAIGSAQATEYRDNVKRNAKRGSHGTAGLGFWGTRAPFGYRRKVVYPAGRERVLEAGVRKAPDEKIALVPHEAEAAIVRELFARYATGRESLASLTDWLMTAYPSRTWTTAAVRFTLTNPAYTGDVVVGRVPGDKQERAVTPVRPASEWTTKTAAHPALVSRALFATVGERIAHNRRATSGVRSDWIVSGLIHCRCGKTFAAGGSAGRNGTVLCYRCTSRGRPSLGRCQYPGAIAKHYLEGAVVGVVADVVGSRPYRSRLLGHMDDAIARLRAAPRQGVETLDREIVALEGRRARLVAAVEEGTLSSLDARERMASLRATLARLVEEREQLAGSANVAAIVEAERERLAALLADFPTACERLHGPALRELLRPWIKWAVFDTETRQLTIDIWRVAPGAMRPLGEDGVASGTKGQTVRRVVTVGRSA